MKTNDVFSEEAWIERDVDFLWSGQNRILYCDVVGWKDIANIFTNFLFCFIFFFFCRWMLRVTVHQVVS